VVGGRAKIHLPDLLHPQLVDIEVLALLGIAYPVAGVYVARGHVFSPPAGFLERPTLFVGRRAHVA
jgi:hypothetical protein